ncbi:[protein-PII] uridylyltransferase [Polaromonas sp.]|jgi:[protein-PII] uridylyltransferase|uniref:[protein-PII] uridylyltransferase n=1 Tax=Polaromonas sp. TaxID=1869339 RepID=UPI002BD7EAA1|nr:[protein-PII] uridylyltransferase [Polaromonas sp.]HQS30888.1 [protein-PII] uridylyltransferase [Polaromonas sp.]HQS89997.1 [protein-PII] uridylyltransferase [Polaromonas sp.]
MTELAQVREQYRAGKTALFASLAGSGASSRGIHSLLHKLALHTDLTLQGLWQRAGLPAAACLVAVGGYGRGQLFPHSDVDVLLLLPDDARVDADPTLTARVEQFIGSCWDSGLEIGSSVRTAAHCVEEAARDVTVQTSLLEARLLAGPKKAFLQLQAQLDAVLVPKAFFVAKTLELRQRHNKFENTPYALEPNCKESPGGLRDLQVVLWVARAAGLGKSWDDLARCGLATPFEVRQIKANEALLSLIRARLHLISGRREDRLVFDLQTAVAESFGYSGQAEDGSKLPRRASEALMKRYYWAAKAVTQLNQILLLNIDERLNPSSYPPRPINARFADKAGMLEVVSDDLYEREPHAILETFLLYETTVGIKGLSARTLRALYNARGVMDSKFRSDPVNHDTFRQILQQSEGITHAMRLMNQTSVLGRYLWVFRKIVGQMQHDLFHVYTVDQHILMVLRNVRRFFMAEHSHEYPMLSQLAAGWDKPWILYIAALFHDIAKGRGGDHSELGCKDVRMFCRQHGIGADDSRLIEFLVGEHLSMSRIAQKEDLSNPDVIAAFARRVGNERYLTALYLLTVADIRGTSPKVWNGWKGKLLEDLYRYTLRVLGGRAPDAGAEVEARKREALTLLALHAEPFEAHKALWESLDVSYFMRHDAFDIAWHARQLSRHVGKANVIVRARRSSAGEGMQVLVYTPDAPDLFARICGYFDQAGFSILDAKVHTARNGYALDTFQVVHPDLQEHYRELASMVEVDLARTIENPGPLPAPGKGRVSRRVKSFPIAPRVDLRPDEKAQRWLLSVSASDRAGLLYLIARVLARHRINLQLAKVTTLGERVEDTFLIDGPELQQNKAQIAIETELLEALKS